MSFFEFPHTRTYDTDLGWLIKDYKSINEALEAIDNWIEETQPTIDDFKNLYEKILAGDLPPAMLEAINIWLQNYAPDVIKEIIKTVFFGITEDGYFVAYIPDSWSDITFGTSGLDDFPAGIDFGHLTLTY